MQNRTSVAIIGTIIIGAAAMIWTASLRAADDDNPIGRPDRGRQIATVPPGPADIEIDNAPRQPGGPRAGSKCVVYLRGDAAGAAWHDRVVDLDSLISRKGTFVRADGDWVVLNEGDKQLYIPRSSIMLIEATKQGT
jgi:hypothetical protein